MGLSFIVECERERPRELTRFFEFGKRRAGGKGNGLIGEVRFNVEIRPTVPRDYLDFVLTHKISSVKCSSDSRNLGRHHRWKASLPPRALFALASCSRVTVYPEIGMSDGYEKWDEQVFRTGEGLFP
jgi:hypothetical protein